MSRKRENVLGQRFGRLVVLSDAPDGVRKGGQTYRRVVCKCDCGNTITCDLGELKKGGVSSCKCYRREYFTKHGCDTKNSKYKKLYNCYLEIKRRCLNKNSTSYKNYGGRGIYICKEWMEDFNSFKEWSVNNGYSDRLTIDRIDVNGNYEPSNCRWADIKTQANNKRNNHYIEIYGIKKTLTEWCEYLHTNRRFYYYGKNLGFDDTTALCREIKYGKNREPHRKAVNSLIAEYARRNKL